MRYLLVAATIALLSSPAAAQPVCAPRGEIVEFLKNEFGEVLAHQGIADSGLLMEVFVAPPKRGRDTPPLYSAGSWTAIITQPDGKSCVAVTGGGWETILAGSPS